MKYTSETIVPEKTLADVVAISERLAGVIDVVRSRMLAPDSIKSPPVFTQNQVGQMCDLNRTQMNYQIGKGALPQGAESGPTKRRVFSLADTRRWVQHFRADRLKPADANGIVISVSNFKGGVTKTTTAVTLAQGLSLRGHKVLVVDLDPQGSMTNLFGFLNADIDYDKTLLPLFMGDEFETGYATQKTYWDGIDIIPASLSLYSADFALPARQKQNPDFEFWNVLRDGIDLARESYDVIIVDTSPALSYLTINALLACDGIIMPIPPSTLDFVSSGQFWELFTDLTRKIVTERGKDKKFSFIDILMARVDSNEASTAIVRKWIMEAYGDNVLPVEVPKTSLSAGASTEFGTVYDLEPSTVNARTYRRAIDAYEHFVELIEEQVAMTWARQVQKYSGDKK